MNRRLTIKWSVASFLVRSPIVRLAAAVPTVGYFILYGDAFAGMFDFTQSLGSSHFWIPADWKLRMVYYGGVSIGAALILYMLLCPRSSKRNHSEIEAIDEFSRTGGLANLMLTPVTASPSELARMFDLGFDTVAIDLLVAMIENSDAESKMDATVGRGYAKIFGTLDESAASQSNALRTQLIRTMWAAYDPDADDEDAAEIREEFVLYFNATLTKLYHGCADKAAVRDAAHSFAAYSFQEGERSRPVAQYAVFALSVAGVIAAALPAIDVFLHVFLGDIGSLG